MRKPKLSIILLALAIGFYSCSDDEIQIVTEEDSESIVEEEEEIVEDPAVTLANDRTSAITLLTGDNEKIWRIATANLVNTNGSFDISENFNVNDDEFLFKNSPLTTGKSYTEFEGSLEWRLNSDIELSAASASDALVEFYVPSEQYNFDFEEGSTKILSNDGNFEFTLAENGSVTGSLQLQDARLDVILTDDFQPQTIPSGTLSFTQAFTFDSNSIAGNAPDMASSLANNSIYISMREDALADPTTNIRPERVLKYDFGTNTLTEKLFPQSDFVSKQLIINNNKLLVVGGQRINTYNLDIVADPTTSQDYATALNMNSFFVSRNGTAVYNNAIYIVGGSLGDTTLANQIYKFDIATESMTLFATMPETRSAARAEIVNNKLYIFGGTKEFYTPPGENTIYIYDLNTAALTTETMPTGVNFTYVERFGNLICVAGSVVTVDNTGTPTDEDPYLGIYDTNNGTFTELTSDLMSPGFETIHGMSVYGSNMYVIYGKRDTTLPAGTLQTWQVLTANL